MYRTAEILCEGDIEKLSTARAVFDAGVEAFKAYVQMERRGVALEGEERAQFDTDLKAHLIDRFSLSDEHVDRAMQTAQTSLSQSKNDQELATIQKGLQ